MINKYYKSDKTMEEELNILSEIEKDELIDVINRLKLCGIYTMEGTR